MNRLDRAVGALYGLAIGDALGMPTQLMSREAIQTSFGEIDGFRAAPDDHPLAAGMPAGSVTDDTEQALLLARLLLDGRGRVDQAEFARRLVAWEDDMRARGSLDLLGPSTKAAVAAVVAGESVELSGRFGTTNGAAMRVTPVGILMPSGDLPALVGRVVDASRLSHNTGIALSGAAAVAAAVSAGVDGASVDEAMLLGVEAAAIASTRGNWVAGAQVAARIRWAVGVVDRDDPEGSLTRVYELVGTSLATQESVPAAFALLALFPDDPWRVCLAGASLGGDSDTIAAMAGAIMGACHGTDAFPDHALETIRTVNRLDLETTALELLELR
jgi:ADP-ribosylglycohydrolase